MLSSQYKLFIILAIPSYDVTGYNTSLGKMRGKMRFIIKPFTDQTNSLLD